MPLSHEQARDFYNRFGSKEDWQRVYEDKALDDLVAHANLEQAQAVFEFGCGTGWLAKRLLDNYLPPTCHYTAMDISETMVRLAEERLAPFGERAEVRITEGEMRIDQEDETYDRFVVTYVLDLLSDSDRRDLLAEVRRMLKPEGLFAAVSLTHGERKLSRVLEKAWMEVYSIRPGFVGGCRPVELLSLLDWEKWRLVHHAHIEQLALASEIIVASKARS